MTQDKMLGIVEMIDVCLQAKTHTIRQVAKLIGKIQATKPANPWAFLYTKQMEIDINRSLLANHYNFEASMQLSKVARQDLMTVREFLPTVKGDISESKPDKIK